MSESLNKYWGNLTGFNGVPSRSWTRNEAGLCPKCMKAYPAGTVRKDGKVVGISCLECMVKK